MVGRVRVGWEGWSRGLGGRAELLALGFLVVFFFRNKKLYLKFSLNPSLWNSLRVGRGGRTGDRGENYLVHALFKAIEGQLFSFPEDLRPSFFFPFSFLFSPGHQRFRPLHLVLRTGSASSDVPLGWIEGGVVRVRPHLG